MSKKFNIHDWQAKQRLAEQDDYQRRQDALTPGKNPDAFYGPGSFYQKMKQKGVTNIPSDEEVESMSNVDIGVLDKMVKKYSMDKIMKTINILKDRPLPEQTMTNFGPVRSATKYNGLPIRDNVMDYSTELLNQINDDENNVGPGEQMIDYNATRKAARDLMDAVDRDEEGMMEANTTGTGASFNAGSGEGYMTPKAFKKKRKDN